MSRITASGGGLGSAGSHTRLYGSFSASGGVFHKPLLLWEFSIAETPSPFEPKVSLKHPHFRLITIAETPSPYK